MSAPQNTQDSNAIIKAPQLVPQPLQPPQSTQPQHFNPQIPNLLSMPPLGMNNFVPPPPNGMVPLINPPHMAGGMIPPMQPQPIGGLPPMQQIPQQQQQQQHQQQPQQAPKSSGEQWKKLWIGNLPEELPDEDVQKLLSFCGEVVSWKRTKDSKGYSAKFGFVEFSQVEAVLKCIRLITDFEIYTNHFLKVKPSEQTQLFLNQWKDLKTKAWSMKNPKDQLGYPTFDKFLEKDDANFSEDIKEILDSVAIKIDSKRKEREKEEEKKEHQRERERDQRRRRFLKELERQAEERLQDWLTHEEEKKRQKRREKEREKDKKEYFRRILEKELQMDSDEERRFVQQKYKLPDRRKFRKRQYDEDMEEKMAELAKLTPPEPKIAHELMPKHTEEMEEENPQPPLPKQSSQLQQQPYKKTFQMQEIIINPERSQNISQPQVPQQAQQQQQQYQQQAEIPFATNPQRHIASQMGFQQQQQQQQQQMQQQKLKQNNGNNQVSGFDDEEEDEEDKQDRLLNKPKVAIPIPGKLQTQQSQQQKQQEQQKSADQLKLELQSIIKQIPKKKEDLFDFNINWSLLAKSDIIEKKVRPWLIQKSKEYLNEEELNFVRMVIKKLNNAESAHAIEKKVAFILEEDAEEFVVKLWRMLIFELLKVEKDLH